MEVLMGKERCVIVVNQSCQMKCFYCYKQDQIYLNNTFNFVEEFCQFWSTSNLNPKDYVFSFFGGEPLLEFESIMKPIILFLNNKSTEIKITCATNGLLLNHEIIDFFKKYNVLIKISIDGDESVFNINRIHKNKDTNAFQQVMNKYNCMDNTYRSIMSTFNKKSIQFISSTFKWLQNLELPPNHWAFSIDFTHSQYNNLEFKIIQRELKEVFKLYINQDKKSKIKNIYFEKILKRQQFNYSTGLLFSISGKIMFLSSTEMVSENNRTIVGSLEQQNFNLDLYKTLKERDLELSCSTQPCAPVFQHNCEECFYNKSNNLSSNLDQQKFICLIRNLIDPCLRKTNEGY